MRKRVQRQYKNARLTLACHNLQQAYMLFLSNAAHPAQWRWTCKTTSAGHAQILWRKRRVVPAQATTWPQPKNKTLWHGYKKERHPPKPELSRTTLTSKVQTRRKGRGTCQRFRTTGQCGTLGHQKVASACSKEELPPVPKRERSPTRDTALPSKLNCKRR